MGFNLNFTHKNEYSLHNNIISEAISLYGVQCKLIITFKQNIDFTVFGDWSNIKTNGQNIFDIDVLPSDQSDIERQEYQFTEFGLNYLYSNEVFISSKSLAKLGINLEALYSALIVFPSNQVMEITDVDFKVPGVNNLWAYTDLKSVIKLTLNSYQFKLHDNIQDKDLVNTLEVEVSDSVSLVESPEKIEENIEISDENFKVLDNYFESILNTKTDQDIESEVRDVTVDVDKNIKEDKDDGVLRPIVDNSEQDPFGW